MKLNGEEIGDFCGTIDDLLTRRTLRRSGIAVALDGEIIPKSQWSTTRVDDIDNIELVTAGSGG